MQSKKLRGGCLCGKVRFELEGEIEVINYCHCSRCRKRSGSAFATMVHARLSNFKMVAGNDRIKMFEPAGWNRRRFCNDCGSPLPGWHEKSNEVGIPAGLFDDDLPVKPSLHIMTGSKADWFDISDTITQYEEFPDRW